METTKKSRILDFILAFVEKTGTMPWKSGLVRKANSSPSEGRSGRYHGFNALICYLARMIYGWDSNLFLTFNEIKRRGGCVKSGEKATYIIHPIFVYKNENKVRITEKEYKELIAKGEKAYCKFVGWTEWPVFNLAQTTLEYEKGSTEDMTGGDNISAQAIVEGYVDGPEIKHMGMLFADGSYNAELDVVKIGFPADYETPSMYYSTLFHELMHSSEHEKRMNLKNGPHGSAEYARMEIRAEIGAAILMSETDLPEVLESNASYAKEWLESLKDSNDATNEIVRAFNAAVKGVSYILGKREDVSLDTEESAESAA